MEPESMATDYDAIHGMKRIQEQVTALKTTSFRQEVGATQPYPAEWDSVKYPPKFKMLTFNPFQGKGSAQQHIYYFHSQIKNLIGNDPVRSRCSLVPKRGFPLNVSASC